MIARDQIVEGLRVRARDGQNLGKVAALGREHFEVEKGFFFPEVHLVAFADVDRVEGGIVHLALPFESLEAIWHAQEDYEEPGEQRRAIETARRRASEADAGEPREPLL